LGDRKTWKDSCFPKQFIYFIFSILIETCSYCFAIIKDI
jgi:hypothetical protein